MRSTLDVNRRYQAQFSVIISLKERFIYYRWNKSIKVVYEYTEIISEFNYYNNMCLREEVTYLY